ncbi:MAG: inorganic pyrophosphatase [Desulfobacteraceae bacterium]|nr:inorganic pyrophosphatase [Desulfobacteraceae bacterium]MBU4035181.1 inorganic pyrophosphatase [Pseudomonadota bacterium]
MNSMDTFWKRLIRILNESEMVIDRPKGSSHPKYPKIVFPIDYGYLKNTSGGDGNEIDVWLGSLENKVLIAIACTVDILKRDTEIKLIVGCNDHEIETIKQFYTSEYMSTIILKK